MGPIGFTHPTGYRDPESQAFIESWFRYLKERCVWRSEFETSIRPDRRSPPTSRSTTTGPTQASTTERRRRWPPSGRMVSDPQKDEWPWVTTVGGAVQAL